ncbi:hypothetical protein AVEN_155534-1 [Araneus ventricosus]|uniref:Uncharacterized protein n=1 Tax=Araneus ventricosus TaxID=182803 RepID=A0A4Y2SHK4_ARAVE|nr:hypothetical protein AVEN_155534-1 [Araneus ventricosus]
MIKRDRRGIRIATLEVKFLDRRKTNYCESICQECFINQERKLEVRRRSDTAPVLTINDASSDPAVFPRHAGSFREPKRVPWEDGAKLKLKGIDGRAHRNGACGLI